VFRRLEGLGGRRQGRITTIEGIGRPKEAGRGAAGGRGLGSRNDVAAVRLMPVGPRFMSAAGSGLAKGEAHDDAENEIDAGRQIELAPTCLPFGQHLQIGIKPSRQARRRGIILELKPPGRGQRTNSECINLSTGARLPQGGGGAGLTLGIRRAVFGLAQWRAPGRGRRAGPSPAPQGRSRKPNAFWANRHGPQSTGSP